MKYTFLTLLTLAFFSSNAQQKNIDSIMGLLAKHPQQDTAMLSLLQRLSIYYSAVDINRGIKIADSALIIAQKIGAPEYYFATLDICKANILAYKGANDSAFVLFKKAEVTYLKLENRGYLAYLYTSQGNSLINAGMYDSGLSTFAKAKSIYNEFGNKEREMQVCMNMGAVYQYIPNYPKALECLNAARLYFEQQVDKRTLATIYVNMANVYQAIKRFGEALKFYNLSMLIFNEIGSIQGVGETHLNMAGVYIEMKNFSSALTNYQKSLIAFRKTNTPVLEGASLVNMGRCNLELKEFLNAFKNIKQGIPLLVEGSSVYISACNYLSNTILQCQDSQLLENNIMPIKRYDSAFYYAKKSLFFAEKSKATDAQFYAWKTMADLYNKQGHYKEAFEAYKQFSILKDSVFNEEKAQGITRNEMQYEYDKEKLLAAAQLERSQQQASRKELVTKAIMIAVFIVILTGMVFYLLYKRKQKEAVLMGQKMVAEEKMRRAQMNPHFMFNSINLIADNIKNEPDPKQQRKYIVSFAKLMRLVLAASVQDETSLAKDLELLETYFQLEKKRKNDGFEYIINIDNAIEAATVFVPPMLLLPIAENSIWHGFKNVEGTGLIKVNISKEGAYLRMELSDNGIGRANAALQENIMLELGHEKSLGLNITKTRITQANMQAKMNGTMHITDLPQGTSVKILIPFKTIIHDTSSNNR